MKRKTRSYSGTRDSAVSAREIKNRAVALKAAEEGIVLLKNDGVLPLNKGMKIALFGSGAGHTIKGGTGSGDVNEREAVTIYQGLVNAGFDVTSADWLESFDQIYQQSREDWKNQILEETEKNGPAGFFMAYVSHPYEMPAGRQIVKEDFGGAKTSVYVISRIAGEGADRSNRSGDYYLTEHEKEDLKIISENSENVIVILNAGGQIDMKDILRLANVKAILSVVQPGMEGGNALAKILTGDVTPSGKLAETWAKNYEDFPNAASFSHVNGNTQKERYEEGIYIGYRYFDSFRKEVEYPFGFGLSYTEFEISAGAVTTAESSVTVSAAVKNAGTQFAGKEIVQVYATCPQSDIPKEYKRLCAFAKTGLLQPGESETLTITFPAKALASFDEKRSAWVVESGLYGIWMGNSSQDPLLIGVLKVETDAVIEEVKHICPLQEELNELVRPNTVMEMEAAWHRKADKKGLVPIIFAPEKEERTVIPENELDRKAAEVVEQLSDEELTAMVIGEISKGQDALGAAGIMVPGAAGETSGALEEKWDIPGISMADGPAGVRLFKRYQVSRETGDVYNPGLAGAVEGGFFSTQEDHEDADTYYQYCTAIPVGTLLAQTWDTGLLEEVGQAVAVEMQEFGVAWWLAPGMNIQRNPLCGRNFEYFSEDPVVSGKMAAAITRGVQSMPGVGTTIKHFACNNQEDNRMGSDSILSERALRELYLRGFEIAVKESQPMAIMTSYNLINGVHAANNYDTCTVVAREEWDFQGIIMTDWTTTENGSEAWKCAAAGNDLIMPGCETDSQNILAALADGRLDRDALKSCAKRMIKVIYQTLGYEDCVSYGAQFR